MVDSQVLFCRLSLRIQFSLSLNYGVLLTEGWGLDHLRVDIERGLRTQVVCVCVCVCAGASTWICITKLSMFLDNRLVVCKGMGQGVGWTGSLGLVDANSYNG